MSDELAWWSEGTVRSTIIEFVHAVTEPGEQFVAPQERVATFDNDGTLWCEKPVYPQVDFLIRRWAAQAEADPSKAAQYPWKTVVDGDRAWMGSIHDHLPELIKGVTQAYAGMTPQEFEHEVRRFFDTARHPTLAVPYTRTGFRPMRELLQFLTDNEFQVYICSGGGRDFIRVISPQRYGVPRER